MERNYYMVRIFKNAWDYAQKGIVAVGWSNVDLSKLSPDDAAKKIGEQEYYADAAPQTLGKKKNEVWRFKYIKKGDIIVVPYESNILLAESEGEFIYSEEDIEADLANQLKVKYQCIGSDLRILPRIELSEGLSRRLRVRGSTVADLYEFAKEVERIFVNADYSLAKTTADKNTKLEKEFKQRLISNIRKGKTHLKTGGEGLEDLVRMLFEIEGYSAKVLSKRAFPGCGDADIEATKRDTFVETKILAQIKHHDWNTGDWGVRQLETIKEGGEYADYKLALITSGDISDDVRHAASNKDIDVMDGDALADWIFSHLSKLPNDVRARLNISDVPMFLSMESNGEGGA
jgi:predicted Mrr-cat superfamily restriction endonuclease